MRKNYGGLHEHKEESGEESGEGRKLPSCANKARMLATISIEGNRAMTYDFMEVAGMTKSQALKLRSVETLATENLHESYALNDGMGNVEHFEKIDGSWHVVVIDRKGRVRKA